MTPPSVAACTPLRSHRPTCHRKWKRSHVLSVGPPPGATAKQHMPLLFWPVHRQELETATTTKGGKKRWRVKWKFHTSVSWQHSTLKFRDSCGSYYLEQAKSVKARKVTEQIDWLAKKGDIEETSRDWDWRGGARMTFLECLDTVLNSELINTHSKNLQPRAYGQALIKLVAYLFQLK